MLTLEKMTATEIRARLFRYIACQPHAIESSRVIEYTPDLCEELLSSELNYHNRNIRDQNLRKIAHDMREGDWGITGDTVKFGLSGGILDGQHRFRGCILAGASFISHTVFGIDDEMYINIDQGQPKTASDNFKYKRIKNPGDMAGACRWVRLLTHPELDPRTHRTTPRPSELLEVYWPMADALHAAHPFAKRVARVYGHPAPLLIALFVLFEQSLQGVHGDAAGSLCRAMFDIWTQGDGLSAPALMKAQETIQRKKTENEGRIHDRVRLAILILAMKAHLSGKKGSMKLFNYQLSQPFPVID